MTKNNENICKIETQGFYDLCNRLKELEEENDFLKAKLEQKEKILKAVKLNNAKVTLERNKAIDELMEIKSLGMFEFADKYCDDAQHREAGRTFAKVLLGGA